MDAALAADAVSAASSLPLYVNHGAYNPHTMANFLPDLMNTLAVATLGLMGAYVTKVPRRVHTHAHTSILASTPPSVPRA